MAAEGGGVLVGAGPSATGDFDGFVFDLEIKVDCAVGLNGYSAMDSIAGYAGGLEDIVVMAKDVGESVWRRNWKSLVSGLIKDPAAEQFGVNGSGGSVGEGCVGLAAWS